MGSGAPSRLCGEQREGLDGCGGRQLALQQCAEVGVVLSSEREELGLVHAVGVDEGLDHVGLDHHQAEPGEHLHARSEEHTSELQSLMRLSYAVFCLTKKKQRHHRYIT